MTGEQARQERFVDAFYREVRAVARMNHPSIVRVFDYGEIDQEIADLSDGQLYPGSPYMIMELAESTLGHLSLSKIQWPHVHTILIHLLDGLAHAHARGLIHRDLKPDNVLFLSDDGDARLKLSDFGVAYAMDTRRHLRAEDDIITGTPRYMAPEQITGELRDQGPWTDLYALGCLAYWLVGGQTPFVGDSIDELLRAHLTAPLPDLEPDIEVPEGFGEWTARLLARDPNDRFRRAADAAATLADICETEPLGTMDLSAQNHAEDSVDLTVVGDPEATRLVDATVDDERPEPDDTSTTEGPIDAPPELPETWRKRRRAPDSIEMLTGRRVHWPANTPFRHLRRDRVRAVCARYSSSSRRRTIHGVFYVRANDLRPVA